MVYIALCIGDTYVLKGVALIIDTKKYTLSVFKDLFGLTNNEVNGG